MGISIWQLVIILVIVLLLFGTKRLRNLGSDLGSSIKGFKNAVKEGKEEAADKGDILENLASSTTDSKNAEKENSKESS